MMEIDSVVTIKEIVGRLKIIPIENCMMVRQRGLVFSHDFAHPDILRELQEEYHRRVK